MRPVCVFKRLCVCVRERERLEIPAKTPQAAEPQAVPSSLQWVKGCGCQVKLKVPTAPRATQGKGYKGAELMVSIQSGWGLSPAVQWNHGIASADSERRAGSAAGWRLYLCTRFLLSLFLPSFFSYKCFRMTSDGDTPHFNTTYMFHWNISSEWQKSQNSDFFSFTLTKNCCRLCKWRFLELLLAENFLCIIKSWTPSIRFKSSSHGLVEKKSHINWIFKLNQVTSIMPVRRQRDDFCASLPPAKKVSPLKPELFSTGR